MPDDGPIDPREISNVHDIRVTHTLHSLPRTVVRITSHTELEMGDPLYINPETLELQRLPAGDRDRAGQGMPVAVVLRVQHRRRIDRSMRMDGVPEYVSHDEWEAEAEITGRPLIVAHQARHVMDTETTSPPCQPFASHPERGPSPVAAALRDHLEREIWRAFCPEHMPGANASDDPLEDR